MRKIARSHPFMLFVILTLVCGLLFFVIIPLWIDVTPDSIDGFLYRDFGYMALPEGLFHAWHYPSIYVFYGYGFSPSLAGLTVAIIGWGPAGFVSMLRRLRPWPSGTLWYEGIKPYAWIVVGFLISAGILASLHLLLNRGDAGSLATLVMNASISGFMTSFAIGMFLQPGGVLEEVFGFRGFAQPLLNERGLKPLDVAIRIGVLWCLWHAIVPFSPFLVEGSALYSAEFWSNQVQLFMYMLVDNIALSIIMAFFVLRSGSVWPAIMIHGLLNELPYGLTLEFGGSAFASQSSMNFKATICAISAVVATGIVFIYGTSLGYNDNEKAFLNS